MKITKMNNPKKITDTSGGDRGQNDIAIPQSHTKTMH